MKSFARLTALLAFFVLAVSCERSAPSSSKVTIAMGGSIAKNLTSYAIATAPSQVGLLSTGFAEPSFTADVVEGGVATVNGCTVCIKSLVINVDSSDFSTIVYQDRLVNSVTAGEELVVSTDLFVPTGSDRLFQVLAMVYDVKEDKLKMQYGYATANLANVEAKVPIAMQWIPGSDGDNEFKPSRIVGRYLSAADSGPTGTVRAFFTYAGKKDIKMFMGRYEINNGWFNFAATENFPLTYKVAQTDEIIFGNSVTSNSLNPSLAPVDYISYLRRPRTYFVDILSKWVELKSYGSILFGYFTPIGADPTILSGKFVKSEFVSVSRPLSNLASDDLGTLLKYSVVYDPLAPADIYGEGPGLATSAFSGPLFTTNIIRLSVEQFNGKGNDFAQSLEGAFSFFTDGLSGYVTQVYKHLSVANGSYLDVELNVLPGLFGGSFRYGGVRAFIKNRDLHQNSFNCNEKWLGSRGFTEITDIRVVFGPSTLGGDAVTLTIPPPAITDNVIVCPTLNGTTNTEEIGGIYLNKVF